MTTPPAATESPRLGTTDAQKLRSTPADALTLTTRSDALLSASDLPAPNPNPAAASAAQSLALSSLSRCVVDLLPKGSSTGAYSATYLSSLRDSLVLLPDAQQRGSVLLQDCERCVVVLGGHQVTPIALRPLRASHRESAAEVCRLRAQIRIHDSADCLFLLAAGSAPIIERCRRLVFAPYPASLATVGVIPSSRAEPLADAAGPAASPRACATRPRGAGAGFRRPVRERGTAFEELARGDGGRGRRGRGEPFGVEGGRVRVARLVRDVAAGACGGSEVAIARVLQREGYRQGVATQREWVYDRKRET